jgi:hypothetical protein
VLGRILHDGGTDASLLPRTWEGVRSTGPGHVGLEAAILERIDPAAWERCGRAEAAEHDSLVSVLGAWRSTMSGQASE